MELKTSRGETYEANWAGSLATSGKMVIELPGMHDIAAMKRDFDGLSSLHTSDPNEGERDYKGFKRLLAVELDPMRRTTTLTLDKGETA